MAKRKPPTRCEWTRDDETKAFEYFSTNPAFNRCPFCGTEIRPSVWHRCKDGVSLDTEPLDPTLQAICGGLD
jgi:hypothetical protein